MVTPRWTFENKITFGNILTIVVMCGGLLAGYMTLVGTVATSADAVKAIPGIENRVTTIETKVSIGQSANERFQDQASATLESLRQQNSQILQSLAAIVARLDEQDKGK